MIVQKSRYDLFANQVRKYIEINSLPFSLPAEALQGGDCFYHAMCDQLLYNEKIFENLKSKITFDLNESNMKPAIIQHRKELGTQDIVCENCRNLCKSGMDHMNYLSQDNVWADEF